MTSCYYIEKYNLKTIKKKASLVYDDMKKVYEYYKTKFQNKTINLLLSEDKSIMYINYKTKINNHDIDVKLELKKTSLKYEDIIQSLLKEFNN